MRKGVVKGFVAVSAVFMLALAVFFVANYIFTAFASVTLVSNKVGFLANATFDTNQTDITINLTISLGNMTGLGVPVQAIDINLSEAGFGNISAEQIRCPDNVTTWDNSTPLSGVLRCANTTGNTLEGNIQIMIRNLSARSSPGIPTFNVSAKRNSSILLENSTAVQVTFLELQASSSLNDTTSGIHEQRSYNFTITNNATDGDYFDTIDQIRIDYTGSGFTDTGGGNVTCPKIPATTGVQWDRSNSSAANTITCSKGGSAEVLGKGSS
ncbi:MAG: hypothetical protein HY368_00205, partial [Candidatus Aenigmarchaeota archaeon]|nr:hypothetical protein [Candidatus Aenigmarchaeota archaeon]